MKDSEYLGWEGGSTVDVAVTKEYRLVIGGVSSECIAHNALPLEVAAKVQAVLDGGSGGSVRVDRTRSEDMAENGYVYYLTFMTLVMCLSLFRITLLEHAAMI